MSQPKPRPGALRRVRAKAAERDWKRPFLAALAETSNVARAASIAGVKSTATVYEARRKSAQFAKAWQAALCEGYANLEMELLGRLRDGEVKPAAGAKRGVRTYDNAIAFRLLQVHTEAVEKEKAKRANASAADIRASIDRKLAALKAKVLAAAERAETPDGT